MTINVDVNIPCLLGSKIFLNFKVLLGKSWVCFDLVTSLPYPVRLVTKLKLKPETNYRVKEIIYLWSKTVSKDTTRLPGLKPKILVPMKASFN